MRKPSLALLGTLCLLSLSPRPVLADADATAVARALTRPAAAPTAAKASKVVAARERRPFREADGRLPLVVRLPAGKPAEAYGLLPIAPGLGAIHLTPEQLKRFRERHPELRPVVAPPRHTLLNASESWTGASAARVANDLDGTGVVVGVIDTGIDAAHPDFRNADGSTRIAWYMQRQSPAGLHPELEERYGCTDPDQSPCAIFSREDIDLALALDPDSAPRDGDGHGTHVTSIAAGNGGIMGAKPKPTYVGVAPGATIISVSPAGGGGFSDPDIINAARFIFDQAEAMGMPAVVNVSLGSDFGPHDGTSALEMGLAALVGAPGRVMTVAAGNSGTLYNLDGQGPFGVHTEVHASPNAVTRVPIQQPGAAGTVDGSGFVWVNFRPGDEVSVGLEGPDGEWIAPVAPGDDRGYDYSFDGFSGNAGVINNVVDDRTQLTRETNGAVVFWEGTWPGETGLFAVTLRGHGDAQLWITGLGGGRQGGGSLGLSFERATKAGTIAVPASHPDLLAVGCTLNRFEWPLSPVEQISLPSFGGQEPPIRDSLCYFSAAGPTPTGAMKPDLVAPGAFVAAAMSRDVDPRTTDATIFVNSGCPDPNVACHVVDDFHAITSGTSMSAPFVAGAAALLLQAQPNLTQAEVVAILQAGASRPTGEVPYDFQASPGRLNVLGALAVLDAGEVGAEAVDAASSWYTLGSSYLRPASDFVAEATIEVRGPGGGLVFGVPQSAIEVRVDNARLAEPVVRVRDGLFRFGLAGLTGTGGTTATVEVRVHGKSLGVKQLPVGVDVWAASGGVAAIGACSLSREPSSRSSFAWGYGALLALAACRRRRR